jgi:alkylation response protein AidB-like acyl-CoA dehydrogenase
VPIGSFQALKHRADMFCEVELSKSVVLEALSALDEGRDPTEIAKPRASPRRSRRNVHVFHAKASRCTAASV